MKVLSGKSVVSVLAGLLAGVVLMVMYTNFGAHDSRDEGPSTSDRDRLAAIEKRLSDLQRDERPPQQADIGDTDQELAQLKQQMSELMLALEAQKYGSVDDNQTSSAESSSGILRFDDPEEYSRLAVEKEMVLRNTLEDNFTNDDVADVDWAQDTQSSIENAFQSEKLLGSALVSSTCKSNICKLEISPDLSTVDGDMDMYQNELLVALSGSLKTSALRVEKNQDGSPRIVGYFGRHGSSITKSRSQEGSSSQ